MTRPSTITSQQKIFCDVYLKTLVVERAVLEAGYLAVGNWKNQMRSPTVRRYLIHHGLAPRHIDELLKRNRTKKYDPMREMTQQQRLFCTYYLSGDDASHAADRAGYQRNKWGRHDMLKIPAVRDYIRKRQKKMEKLTTIDFAWKVKKLVAIIEAVVGEGKKAIDKQYMAVAIGAIKTLNDMQGHNADSSYIPQNVLQDEDIKRVRELTFKILEEKQRNGQQTIEYQPEQSAENPATTM